MQTARAARDSRGRRIVEARWPKKRGAATLHELAAEFKVSTERTRQLETKAFSKEDGDPGEGLTACPSRSGRFPEFRFRALATTPFAAVLHCIAPVAACAANGCGPAMPKPCA